MWLQIVSDVTGRDQVVPQQRIGASYGDALTAAIGTAGAEGDCLIPYDPTSTEEWNGGCTPGGRVAAGIIFGDG